MEAVIYEKKLHVGYASMGILKKHKLILSLVIFRQIVALFHSSKLIYEIVWLHVVYISIIPVYSKLQIPLFYSHKWHVTTFNSSRVRVFHTGLCLGYRQSNPKQSVKYTGHLIHFQYSNAT